MGENNRNDIQTLLKVLGDYYPYVATELKSQVPLKEEVETLQAIHAPPLVLLTMMVAGISASIPGIHHIHVYGQQQEISRNIYRMLLNLASQEDGPKVIFYTRRTRPLKAAFSAFPQGSSQRERLLNKVSVLSCSTNIEEVPTNGQRQIFHLDLDYLSKTISFSTIRKLLCDQSKDTIILMGHREHPLLYGFRRAAVGREWVQWGVNREQIKAIDAPIVKKSRKAIETLNHCYNGIKLPNRFQDIKPSDVIPKSKTYADKYRRRIWASIAGAYEVQEAKIREDLLREIIYIDSQLPAGLSDAADAVRSLIWSARRKNDLSYAFAQAIEDIAFYRTLPMRTCVPLPFVIKELGGYAYSRGQKPVDRLMKIKRLCETKNLGPAHLQAQAREVTLNLLAYYETVPFPKRPSDLNPDFRVATFIEEMNTALKQGLTVAILTMNIAERRAAEKYLRPHIDNECSEYTPSRSQMRKNLLFYEGRLFHPQVDVDLVLMSRIPSYEHLDHIINAGVKHLKIVINKQEQSRAVRVLHYDLLREVRFYEPKSQRFALQIALKTVPLQLNLPSAMEQIPVLPRDAIYDPAICEAEQDGGAEGDEDPDFLEYLLDLQTEARTTISHAANRCTLVPEPTTTKEHFIIYYEDGGYDVVDREEVLFRLTEDIDAPEEVTASELSQGDLLLTSNDAKGSAGLSEIIVELLAKHDPTVVATDYLDQSWRNAILDFYRNSKGTSWSDLLQKAQEHGYSNKTESSIHTYVNRRVWLPRRKADLRALMEIVSPNNFGDPTKVEEIWKRTGRLKKMSSTVLRYAKRAAITHIDSLFSHDSEEDSIIIKDIGLRESHLDGYFQLRRIKKIDYPEEVPL